MRASLILGGLLTLLVVGAALASLVWTPMDPTKIQMALRHQPPLFGSGGWLGNDQLGRDMASALMAGAWNSLSIAVSAVALGGAAGTLVGLTAAVRGGWPDGLLMRACDALFALPPILSAIIVAAILGGGARTAILAIGVFMIPVFARIARSAALQIGRRDYVLAARMAGKGRARIALEHMAPNIAGQILVQFALQTGLSILTEASLSFLGLGAPSPQPSWGRMLAGSQTYLQQSPHLALLPGLAIAMAVLGFNLLADGLAARMDPRRRQAS